MSIRTFRGERTLRRRGPAGGVRLDAGGTTPFQACDVVADFDIGDGHTVRETCRFSNGRFHYDGSCDDIDWPVVRWMALPPIVSESDTGAEMG